MEESPTLDFKYLRNVMVYIGGELYPIPMTMKENRALSPKVDPNTNKGPIVPVFDMDKVHKVPLQDEAVELPDKADYAGERDYQEECEIVYEERRAARKHNDIIRAEVYHYVKNGTLEIAHDPFAKRKIKGISKSSKPSDMAAEMDERVAATTAKATVKDLKAEK
jgi:hypothetical protein